MVSGLVRPIGLLALVMAAVVGLAVPLAPMPDADAAGSRYEVSNWTDPDGHTHRIRWNPCQTITFAVNPKLAGRSAAARASAVEDVQQAFRRVGKRVGIDFAYAGRTDEIPRDGASQSWSSRQKAAEIVVAWVDQARAATRSNLIGKSGGRYPSGVGGWMMRWTQPTSTRRPSVAASWCSTPTTTVSTRAGFGSGTTRGALLLHEIGHVMGLGHVGTTRELMYPTMLERGSSNYKRGDRTGLAKVGRSLGCIKGANDFWPQI